MWLSRNHNGRWVGLRGGDIAVSIAINVPAVFDFIRTRLEDVVRASGRPDAEAAIKRVRRTSQGGRGRGPDHAQRPPPPVSPFPRRPAAGGRRWENAKSIANLNTAIEAGGERIRRRGLHAVINNPYLANAARRLPAAVVGTGIRLQSRHPDPAARKANSDALGSIRGAGRYNRPGEPLWPASGGS